MKTLLGFFTCAVIVDAAVVYDCRDYDCVTQFTRIRGPLPAPGTIPLPAGYAPCGPGNPNQICGTLTGLTGLNNNTGMSAGSFSSGPERVQFFFNGTSTVARIVEFDFNFSDLADNGLMLMNEGGNYQLLSSGLSRYRGWFGPYFPPSPDDLLLEYRLYQRAGGRLSQSGNAVRLPANRFLRLPLAGQFATRIPFCEFELCTFDGATEVIIPLNSSFVPIPLPEPGTISLVLVGLGAACAFHPARARLKRVAVTNGRDRKSARDGLGRT